MRKERTKEETANDESKGKAKTNQKEE